MLSIRPVRVVSTHAIPRKVKASDVKRAIQQAQNLCFNFENTPACRSAWELVEDLTHAYDAQKERTPEPERSELSKRDYEV